MLFPCKSIHTHIDELCVATWAHNTLRIQNSGQRVKIGGKLDTLEGEDANPTSAVDIGDIVILHRSSVITVHHPTVVKHACITGEHRMRIYM